MNPTPLAHPEILYRAFRERQHVQDFVEKGKFRLGLLETYRSIEDQSRQDSREGESSSYIKTNVMKAAGNTPVLGHLGGSYIGPIYIMCTSAPRIDLAYLRKRFGNWVVRINDPSRFLLDLRNAVPTNSNVTIGTCSLEPVCYTKDEIADIDSDSFEAIRLNWTQKPREFLDECEYRFVVKTRRIVEHIPEPYLTYDFNAPIPYAEFVERDL